MNWFEIEFVLLKHLKLQPSELDKMEFYRVEYLMENFKAFIDKENDRNKRQHDEQNKNQDFDMNSMQSNQNKMINKYIGGNSLSKMAGNFKMPKF
jgi:hypothetical protein